MGRIELYCFSLIIHTCTIWSSFTVHCIVIISTNLHYEISVINFTFLGLEDRGIQVLSICFFLNMPSGFRSKSCRNVTTF